MTHTIFATNETLKSLIAKEMEKHGPNCSLNHIDVSQVTNMSYMFFGINFNGDISNWNTSNVTNMSCMFDESGFNGDISQWDTSSVTNMSYMFFESKFTGDLRPWNKTELQLKEAFVDSYEEYLEKRRIILEHEQLVGQFQVNGTTKKTRLL